MDDLVECRSESDYAGRPLAFYWQGERLSVTQVLAGWRTPQGKCFRVGVDEGRVFQLFYDEADDAWRIVEE